MPTCLIIFRTLNKIPSLGAYVTIALTVALTLAVTTLIVAISRRLEQQLGIYR